MANNQTGPSAGAKPRMCYGMTNEELCAVIGKHGSLSVREVSILSTVATLVALREA